MMKRFEIRAVGLGVLLGSLPLLMPTRGWGAGADVEALQPEDNIAKILSQMRWKLESTDWDLGVAYPVETIMAASPAELERLIGIEDRINMGIDRQRMKLHRTVEALLLDGRKEARERAVTILRRLVALHGAGEISSVVTEHGIEFPGVHRRTESGGKVYEPTEPNAQRMTVLNVRDLAYEYAALYLLTGEKEAAGKGRDILLQFAKVMPSWPLYDRDNRPHAQSDTRYLADPAANGLWSVWNPLDMRESLSLLRSYDILRPSLGEEERKAIENGIFVHQKGLNDRYLRNETRFDNLQGYRLPALILFGRVLARPDYVHEAVAYMRRLLRYSFTADGFWREVSPGYHRQVAVRLMESVPNALKGYSDPEGYLYATSGERFDRLKGAELFEADFGQMETGLNVLAMPDRTYATLNDAWPKKDRVAEDVDDSMLDRPGLLGIAGVAKLGAGGMVVLMEFGGMRGHDHDSSLNLVWFAGGREVFSETSYQALPGSDSSREWHTMSASHHTVTVNEHTNLRAKDRLPESLRIPREGSAEAQGKPVTAIHPVAAEYANQGRLLLWRPEGKLAQAMEAEREQTYPGVTSLYRRAVVMIPGGKGDGTVVEIFRIRGGKVHDYALRGGLDEPYKMEFDAPLRPASGTLYKYINLQQSAEIRPPLQVKTVYGDGYRVDSRLLAVSASAQPGAELLVGEAPAIRRLGHATFSMVRHGAPDARDGLESCYVWVHEAGTEGTIRSARAEVDKGNVVVVIEREDRTDFVFSSEQDAGNFSFEGWDFTGHLAYARRTGAGGEGAVFQGGELKYQGAQVAEAAPPYDGPLLEVTRRDTGADAGNSLLVRLAKEPSGDWMPLLVHIDFGTHIRFSIPVENGVREGDAWRLKLAHAPGFELTEQHAVMTHAPGWSYAGVPSVRVEGKTPATKPR